MRHFSFVILASVFFLSCAGTAQKPGVRWVEDDKRPIAQPKSYWSGLYWDGADKIVFRPLSRFFLFEVKGPAQNVNRLEEVLNSSWYTNRLALFDMSPEEVAKGPCESSFNVAGPIIVKGGKVDGANPGFRVEDPATGANYLMKFDSVGAEPYRATAGDVIGSKIYHAAGFETPCNEVIYFDPAILRIGEDASKRNPDGEKVPMTRADIDGALAGVSRNRDGLVRGSASLFVVGKPIGPFTYEGTRSDDPNDVINHENRRELRGSRLLAAWTQHFDAREQNTMTTFVETGDGTGYVQHYIIDFGDIFGSQWEADEMSRRFGHSYYFDPTDVPVDFLTLGLIHRPWDKVSTQEEGEIFGYYDVKNFEPHLWKNGYPNGAFNFMDETDAYWMTRIISRFSDEHVDALVAEGKIPDPAYVRYLSAMIRGRRDKIVHHYFSKMSPLDRVSTNHSKICWEDLFVVGGYGTSQDAFYETSVGDGEWSMVQEVSDRSVCVDAPEGERFEIRIRVRRSHQQEFAKPGLFEFVRENEKIHLDGVTR